MKTETLRVGQLAANCYLFWELPAQAGKKTLECLIIDPGDDVEYIQNRIRDLNLIPQKIITTHAHFDHIQAVFELKLAYKIPFLIHYADLPLLKHYRSSTKYYTGLDPGPAPHPDSFIKNNEKLIINHQSLKIIHTPGHTPGSICLYSQKERVLFSGDTIFASGGVGRTDFSYSDPLKLQNSINKIFKLPEETIIYPGHGEPTTIQAEVIAHKNMLQEG